LNALLSQQWAAKLLADEDLFELADESREVVAIDDVPPRAIRQRVHNPLGGVREPLPFLRSDSHGSSPATTLHSCSTSACEGCIS
jgi:hypothetical protein